MKMRRSASHLAHLVRSYLLYLELDAALANAQRKRHLMEQRLVLVEGEISELLRGVAREFGREEDIDVSFDSGELRISENILYSLLEELTDQALRQSRVGNKIKILGKKQISTYRFTMMSQISSDPAAVLLASGEDVPLGLQLARRITEIFGGSLDLQESRQGESRTFVELPLA